MWSLDWQFRIQPMGLPVKYDNNTRKSLAAIRTTRSRSSSYSHRIASVIKDAVLQPHVHSTYLFQFLRDWNYSPANRGSVAVLTSSLYLDVFMNWIYHKLLAFDYHSSWGWVRVGDWGFDGFFTTTLTHPSSRYHVNWFLWEDVLKLIEFQNW
jgi:hypothetical protein